MKKLCSKLSVLPLVGFLALTACSSEKVFDNTTDAVVFTGRTAVKGAYGAGRLLVRGAAAGAKRLRTATDEHPAGTIVCLSETEEIYAAAVETNGEYFCPPYTGS